MDQNRPQSSPGYSGSSKEYVPQVGNLSQSIRSTSSGTYKGYHDINLLRSLLEQIINDTSNIMNAAESKLEKLNLQVSDVSLQNAQKTEWPSDLGEPKDYVSFHQYQAFKQFDTRGSNFISKAYEDTVRGVAGNPALDVYIISGHIKDEAISIKGFLDDFIGSIDDTAEFRILEAFQDWAFMALKYARVFGSFIEARAEVQQAIPEAELEKLTQDQAKSFQVLFKTKVNGYNDEISKTLESLKTQFAHTDDFFTKFLGPSLKFRLNFQGDLSKTQSTGFFGSQAQNASRQMQGNIEAAVTDLVRRNDFFGKRFNELETRLKARSSYVQFVKDLEPTGARLKNPFVDVQPDPEEKQAFKSLATQKVTEKTEKNPFYSSHFDLADLDSDDAHPQYLLRSGGNLTGDVTVDDGVKIDGVDIGEHRHKGKDIDGTYQIDGADIASGTLTSDIVKTDEAVCTPKGLRLLTTKSTVVPPGVASVNAQIAWDTCSSGLMYELQIVPTDISRGDGSSGVNTNPWYVDTMVDISGSLGSDYPVALNIINPVRFITNPVNPGFIIDGVSLVELNSGQIMIAWSEFNTVYDNHYTYIGYISTADNLLFGAEKVQDIKLIAQSNYYGPNNRLVGVNLCRAPDGNIWLLYQSIGPTSWVSFPNSSIVGPPGGPNPGFGAHWYKSVDEGVTFQWVCELPWSSQPSLTTEPSAGLGQQTWSGPIIEADSGRWMVVAPFWTNFFATNNVQMSAVYTSDDQGLTWTVRYASGSFNNGCVRRNILKVAPNHYHIGVLGASLPGANTGIVHSTDNGDTWSYLEVAGAGSGLPIENGGISLHTFNSDNPSTPKQSLFKEDGSYIKVYGATGVDPLMSNGDWVLQTSWPRAAFGANGGQIGGFELSQYWLFTDAVNIYAMPKADVASSVTGLASGKDYVAFSAVNNANFDPPFGSAVYIYKWGDGTFTKISGSLSKQYPDIPFKSISDITQDFSNDDIYALDSLLFKVFKITNAYASAESAITTNILDFSSVTDIYSVDAIDVATGNNSPCDIYALVTAKKYDNDLASYVYQYSIYKCVNDAGVWTKSIVPGSQSDWSTRLGHDIAVMNDGSIFVVTKDISNLDHPVYLYELKDSAYTLIPQDLPSGDGVPSWFIESISSRPDGTLYVAFGNYS